MAPDIVLQHRRLWILFGAALFGAFFILGFFGREVYRQAPPIPDRVVTSDGRTLMTQDSILTGQQVWQSTGGQQLGSIWGHGAYQAPDWASVDQGLWYARSAEFLQLPAIETLRWMRLVGDTVFTVGALAFAWFMAGLFFGWSHERAPQQDTAPVGAARRSA